MSSHAGGRRAALATAAAVIFLSACGSSVSGGSAHQTSQDQTVVTAQPAGHSGQDINFAESIIANHKQAIALSALVPSRSVDHRLVAAATAERPTLQSDIQVLKVMLVQWNESPDADTGGGRAATVSPGMVDQNTYAKLEASQGKPFDSLWLQSMIGLDQGALEIATAEIAANGNEDAVGLARQIAAQRTTDIGTMKQLLGSS